MRYGETSAIDQYPTAGSGYNMNKWIAAGFMTMLLALGLLAVPVAAYHI